MIRQISHVSRRARRAVRALRSGSGVHGTAARPRLSVFRSHRHLAVQLVDDDASRTLLGLTDVHLPKPEQPSQLRGVTKKAEKHKDLFAGVARGHSLGRLLAERARALGVTAVVFDRGGYAYHGQVKAVAEGAREGGLKL